MRHIHQINGNTRISQKKGTALLSRKRKDSLKQRHLKMSGRSSERNTECVVLRQIMVMKYSF